jgi:atypical dual specificity phosphatase
MEESPIANFSWLLPGELAGSSFPREDGAGQWLVDQGIRAVISLTENVPPTVKEAGLDSLHLPTVDFTPPTVEQVAQAVAFIERKRAAKQPVLVHCGAGLGRTGTILACYLVFTGLSPEAAIAQVRQARPGSLETANQVETVRTYARGRGRADQPD